VTQSNYNIANDSAPAVRTQLNAIFGAIATNNSGATAPATTFAHQWWYDTATDILKQRNAADSAWIDIGTFDQTGGTFTPIGTPQLTQEQAENAASTVFGTVSGQRLAQAFSQVSPVLQPAQATTSGTAFDFLDVPAGANFADVVFDSVSLSGADNLLVQIGPAAGFVTAGYTSQSVLVGGSNVGLASVAGFIVGIASGLRTANVVMRLRRVGGNAWVSTHSGEVTGLIAAVCGGGRISLAGPLNRIRITRTGANTFDAGQVSVRWGV
jgi:hypothetical protein